MLWILNETALLSTPNICLILMDQKILTILGKTCLFVLAYVLNYPPYSELYDIQLKVQKVAFSPAIMMPLGARP